MKRHRVVALAASCAVAAVAFSAIAHATEVEGFELSDAHPKVTKTYGPMPVSNPSGQVSAPTVANCRQLPSDRLVPVSINMSNEEHPNAATIEVSWHPNNASNDVDIYFFDEGGDLVASSPTGSNPEKINLAGLTNSQYSLCAVNFSGAPTDFTVKAAIRYVELYERPPVPTTPPPPTIIAPTKTARPVVRRAPKPVATKAAPLLDPVKTLGADGPKTAEGLFAVAGAKQAAPPDDGVSPVGILFAVLTVLIGSAGATLVVLRIRRETS